MPAGAMQVEAFRRQTPRGLLRVGLGALGEDVAQLGEHLLEQARVAQLSAASACVCEGAYYCARLEYRGGVPLALTEAEWHAYLAAKQGGRLLG